MADETMVFLGEQKNVIHMYARGEETVRVELEYRAEGVVLREIGPGSCVRVDGIADIEAALERLQLISGRLLREGFLPADPFEERRGGIDRRRLRSDDGERRLVQATPAQDTAAGREGAPPPLS